MFTATPTSQDLTDNKRTYDKRQPTGNWELHSWGSADLPGMAAVSAITALQVGATLTNVLADKIALDQAAEYLTKTLAPQLRSFQQAVATD